MTDIAEAAAPLSSLTAAPQLAYVATEDASIAASTPATAVDTPGTAAIPLDSSDLTTTLCQQ